MTPSSKVKKNIRRIEFFRKDGLNNIFFIIHKDKPICLICNETVSVLKEYNLKRHYNTKH